MRRRMTIAGFTFLLGVGLRAGAAGGEPWDITKSDHFVVSARGVSRESVDEIIRHAERCYDDVTRELGFTRFDNFWTWEKRAKIYVLANRLEYAAFVRGGGWSGARVDVITREIVTYAGMEGFFDNILVHEVGHIVFREFVGFDKRLPLWVDEGIATYLEKRLKPEREWLVRAFLETPGFMTAAELGRVQPGRIQSPLLFYAQAGSLIEFLVSAHGKERFRDFCRGLRRMPVEGDWEEVLRRTYRFTDLEALNREWIEFLRKAAP